MLQRLVEARPPSRRKSRACGGCPAVRWGGAGKRLPDPVRVTLNPATTALLLLDYVEPICNSQPKCKGQILPAMTPFMARARKAGVVVAYGTRDQNMRTNEENDSASTYQNLPSRRPRTLPCRQRRTT